MNVKLLLLALAPFALLAAPTEVKAWGAAHVGYTHVGPTGVYHRGQTVGVGPGGVYRTGGASAYGAGGAYHSGYTGYRTGYTGAYRVGSPAAPSYYSGGAYRAGEVYKW